MKSLKEAILEAGNKKVAIGHFNFAELTVLKAAEEAARELGVPIILGCSEKEREFLGADFLQRILNPKLHSLFFNADHCKSLESVKEAVELGFNSITFDGSDLPLEENIKKTKEVVDYVKSAHPEILVEGEIGYIASGSQLRETIPEGIQLTTTEEAIRFVQEAGVDMLAPAVGNIHGIVKSGEPRLDIELIKKIKEAVKIPLVLHGASGNSDEDIKAAIAAGINIIHINTEVRLAWKNELDKPLHEMPNELAPYKILAPAEEAAKEVIKKKLQLFNGLI
ncbi:MAG: class II fructose-bisphosphate aldolase [Patescibacteria group bacterium]